jgi:hypothetical protein
MTNSGLASGVPTQFLSVGGFDFPTALIDTTTFLDGIANPPAVMTTSYGNTESCFGASVATSVQSFFSFFFFLVVRCIADATNYRLALRHVKVFVKEIRGA